LIEAIENTPLEEMEPVVRFKCLKSWYVLKCLKSFDCSSHNTANF